MKISPALAYLASQPWAMEFDLYDRMSALLQAHAQGERVDAETVAAFKAASASAPPAESAMQWSGKTAIIPVRGVLARYSSSVGGMCQPQGRSAEAIQADIMSAAERGADRIILRIDSPGGEVAGTSETAQMLAGLPETIQTIAYIDGQAASAAYWIASQAGQIIASSPMALVGSIGVATSVPNGSGSGRTTITSAPAKSSPVTNEAHMANAKQIVSDMAGAFADAVAAGRGLSEDQALTVATGEVWTAERAQSLGLIDGVAAWADVLAGAQPSADQTAAERRRSMAGRMAARVTVAGAAASARAESESSKSPAAATSAQAPSEAPTVDPKLMATLAALCQTHSTHAAALVAEANKPGATAEGLHAFASTKASEAKDAEIAALKAKLTEVEAKAKSEAEARAKAESDLAKLTAHQPPADPGGDGDKPRTITSAELEKMDPLAKAKFFAAKGVVADK